MRVQGYPDGRPAVDYTVNAEVGIPQITGSEDGGAPVNHVLPAWDLVAGLSVSTAVLAALYDRDRTGRGTYVELALADVALAGVANLGWLSESAERGRDRPRHGNHVYGSFGVDFACSDGQRVMVVALTPGQWTALTSVTGTQAVFAALEQALGADLTLESERYRLRDTIAAVLKPWFLGRDSTAVAEELDAARVLWGRYQRMTDVVAAHRGGRAPGARRPRAARRRHRHHRPLPAALERRARRGGRRARVGPRHRRGARGGARAERGRDREPARSRRHRMSRTAGRLRSPRVSRETARPRHQEITMPKYLLLKHYRGGPEPHRAVPPMDQWAPEDVEAHLAFLRHVAEVLEERGEYVGAQALVPARTWVRYSGPDAAPVTTDGPHPETSDLVAGWYMIDVESYERALEVAAFVSGGPGPGGEPMYEWIDVREIMG